MTEVSIEVENQQLECILLIQHLVKFQKGHTQVQALIYFGDEVNTITRLLLKLYISLINIKAQKIDRCTLLIYSMVLSNFQVEDKQEKIRFFQKAFLMANTSIEVVLEIFFLALNKIEINFADQKLNCKTYTLNKALPMTKQV